MFLTKIVDNIENKLIDLIINGLVISYSHDVLREKIKMKKCECGFRLAFYLRVEAYFMEARFGSRISLNVAKLLPKYDRI